MSMKGNNRISGKEKGLGSCQEVGFLTSSVIFISQLSQAEQGGELEDSSSAFISMLSQEHKRNRVERDIIVFM